MDMILGPFLIALALVGAISLGKAFWEAFKENGFWAAVIGMLIFAVILWVIGALVGFLSLAAMWVP